MSMWSGPASFLRFLRQAQILVSQGHCGHASILEYILESLMYDFYGLIPREVQSSRSLLQCPKKRCAVHRSSWVSTFQVADTMLLGSSSFPFTKDTPLRYDGEP